jgi:S1-C subfamily serine protease
MRIFFFLFLVFCQIGEVAATEGPRAFFGFVTHYERTSSGRGEVLIQQVVPSSPAQRAGLSAGDRIVAFNDVGFYFADEYQYMRSLGVFESGRKLVLTIHRGGREFKVELVPE